MMSQDTQQQTLDRASTPKADLTDEQQPLSPYHDRYLTIPNAICLLRIIGSIALIPVAVYGYAEVFVAGFITLSLSDWIDGKLARWLNQQSVFGARLDSFSDSILYICLIIGSLILKWDVLQRHWIWVALPLMSYAITTGYGLWKFGRIPSYHTRGAKISQWLVLGAGVALLLDWSLWPLRIAAVAVTMTNLEATAMTYVLSEWQSDLLTLAAAKRKQHEIEAKAG